MVPPTTTQAQILARQGFRVVPVRGKDRPTVKGFDTEHPDATWGPEYFGSHDTLVALLCGPCPALGDDWLLCADFDGDLNAAPAVLDFFLALPEALTSHGGMHVFFRVPPSPERDRLYQWADVFDTRNATGAALDLKWAGGYAAERWDWLPGTDTEHLVSQIPILPAELLARLLTSPKATRAHVIPGDDGLFEREELTALGFAYDALLTGATKWLQATPTTAISGAGGSDAALFVAGACLSGWGLTRKDALDLMLEHWNTRCEPEWSDVELEHKLDKIEEDGGSSSIKPLELAWAARNAREQQLAELREADTRPAALSAIAEAIVAPPPKESDDEALLTWNGHLKLTSKGEIANTQHNTLWTLHRHPAWCDVFAYDEFSHEEVYLRRPTVPECPDDVAPGAQVQDHHITAFRGWFSRVAHHPSHDDLLKAIQAIARKRTRHAVREYLGALRGTWDGKDRNLTAYFGAEPTPYQRAVCAKWLRSAIARVMRPPVQSDNMLILEGKQGIRKSSALRALCPDIRWYQEISSRAVGAKDFMQDMSGIWLAEFPEVDQLIRSREESELKSLLTRTADRYRPSYARKSETFPRQMIFGGTTNEEDYLKDATGNRRYWPIKCSECGPIRDGAICDDRDQIWAQALHEYEQGLQWWLDPAEDLIAGEEQALRLEQDPWAELIGDWLAKQGEEPFTCIDAIAAMPEGKLGAALEQRDMNRMGRVLRKLGYVSRQCRIDGKRTMRWFTSVESFRRYVT